MTDYNLDQKAKLGTLLSINSTTFTGASQLLGTLLHNPVIMFIQNDTLVPVFLSDDGTSTNGKTFIPGERAVLDMRGNEGKANNFSFPIGTTFFVTAAASTGLFQISYIYAQ